MDFLNGITLLLLYELLGEVSVLWLKLPIPGPVVGMILLFSTLVIKGRSPAALDQASTALLSHLSLLFVPAGVGIMSYFDLLMREWLPICLVLFLSTVMTMATTAVVMQTTQLFMFGRVQKNG